MIQFLYLIEYYYLNWKLFYLYCPNNEKYISTLRVDDIALNLTIVLDFVGALCISRKRFSTKTLDKP